MQTTPQFYCENTEMPITEGFEMLRVTLDDKLNFEKHRVKVCRKLSQQVTAFTGTKKDAPL